MICDSLLRPHIFHGLTLTSGVWGKFSQGTNVTTVVVHGLPLCEMARFGGKRKYCRKEFKFIPIFKDKCTNYNSIGYSCILFLKTPK